MQIGDTIRARFLTMPEPFPGVGATKNNLYPVRKATVVYVHLDYDLEYALFNLTEVDKKIMAALGML